MSQILYNLSVGELSREGLMNKTNNCIRIRIHQRLRLQFTSRFKLSILLHSPHGVTGQHKTVCTGIKNSGAILRSGDSDSLPRSHIPTCQHTMWKEKTWEARHSCWEENSNSAPRLLKHWHKAPSGGGKQVLQSSKILTVHPESPHDRHKHNQSAFLEIVFIFSHWVWRASASSNNNSLFID